MLKAPPRKYEFPPKTPPTGTLKIWPLGLKLLMKLKFQRSFLKPSRPNLLQVYTTTIPKQWSVSWSSIFTRANFTHHFLSAYPPPLIPRSRPARSDNIIWHDPFSFSWISGRVFAFATRVWILMYANVFELFGNIFSEIIFGACVVPLRRRPV